MTAMETDYNRTMWFSRLIHGIYLYIEKRRERKGIWFSFLYWYHASDINHFKYSRLNNKYSRESIVKVVRCLVTSVNVDMVKRLAAACDCGTPWTFYLTFWSLFGILPTDTKSLPTGKHRIFCRNKEIENKAKIKMLHWLKNPLPGKIMNVKSDTKEVLSTRQS